MIKELLPLLTTHNLGFDVRIKDDALHVHVIPTLIDESIKDAKDLNILERPLFKKYVITEFSNEDLAHELNNYQAALGEGTDIITTLAKEIEQRAKEKLEEEKAKASAKKPATTKRATNAKKPAPKRKTKQQLMDEAREKQAQERKDEKPPAEDGNRLDATPAEKPAITPDPAPANDDPLGLGLGDLDL